MAQLVKHLLSRGKALSSIPSTTKNKLTNKQKKQTPPPNHRTHCASGTLDESLGPGFLAGGHYLPIGQHGMGFSLDTLIQKMSEMLPSGPIESPHGSLTQNSEILQGP
jgi:hypothetical protein